MTLTVLLFWIYLLLLSLVFALQWLSLYWEILIICLSFQRLSNLKQDSPFHCVAYDYSRADWNGFRDHLRDVPWEDIFNLSASTAACEFCEWLQVRIDVCIPHHKYQAILTHRHTS